MAWAVVSLGARGSGTAPAPNYHVRFSRLRVRPRGIAAAEMRISPGDRTDPEDAAQPVRSPRNPHPSGHKRCGGHCEAMPATLVELMAPHTVDLRECTIELEGRNSNLRIHWKGATAVDVESVPFRSPRHSRSGPAARNP